MSLHSSAHGNPPGQAPQVVLYSKPQCLLCDEALEQIELAKHHIEFHFTEVNILGAPELYARYKHLIPVVTVESNEIARYRIRWQDLVARLEGCWKNP